MKKEICVLCGAVIMNSIIYSYFPACEKCLEEHKNNPHILEGSYSIELGSSYVTGINSTAMTLSGTSFPDDWFGKKY